VASIAHFHLTDSLFTTFLILIVVVKRLQNHEYNKRDTLHDRLACNTTKKPRCLAVEIRNIVSRLRDMLAFALWSLA